MSEQTPQPKSEELLAKLPKRHRDFVLCYAANGFNATRAAKESGYSEATARQQGSRLLTNVDIRAAVDAVLAEQAMPKTEVVARLTAQARGDMGEFLRTDEEDVTLTWSILRRPPGPDGLPNEAAALLELAMQDQVKPTDLILATATVKRSAARLDLLAAGEAGRLGLVKKYSIDKDGKVSIELYDAQAALVKLGEAHGIFRDRIADGLDAVAAAARSLEQKLLPDVGPGPPDGVPGAPDPGGEGGPTL